MFIRETLQSLRNAYANGSRIVLSSEGYYYESICVFNVPALSNDISNLLSKYSKVPKDYLEFLSITNGCKVFADEEHFHGSHLYSADEVLELNGYIEHPTRISVACSCDDYILIDFEDVRAGRSEYMYVNEGIGNYDYARSLYCDFQTWLDRFVMAQGNKYWTWRTEDRKF